MNAVPQKTVEVEDCDDCPFYGHNENGCFLDPGSAAGDGVKNGMPREACRLRPESEHWAEVVVRIKRV